MNCILHVCGGDPVQMRSLQLHFVYSPRMWRWSWQAPTIHFSWCCILHVCGGDPTSLQVIHGDHLVFSTYVEVILRLLWPYWFGVGILHVCGGDPIDTFFGSWLQVYSPRMWRWSHAYDQMAADQAVFSTYVEVIPIIIFCTSNVWCILHVCGGDPHTRLSMSSVCQYSPRMWRWSWSKIYQSARASVFSTYVEVIHNLTTTFISGKRYSPRMWRWSQKMLS